MLLHRPHNLNVSAVFRRGQSQQVSSLIQYTFWQAKINTQRFVCQLLYPHSHVLLTLASPWSLPHLLLSEKFVLLQFTNYLNHSSKTQGRSSPFWPSQNQGLMCEQHLGKSTWSGFAATSAPSVLTTLTVPSAKKTAVQCPACQCNYMLSLTRLAISKFWKFYIAILV